MKFYTNCALYKNKVLLRGYENGERFQRDVYYNPYLFVSSSKRSPFKTIDGRNVEKKYFDSFGEARNYLNQYSGVGGMSVYGQDAFLYTFIYDSYPGQVQYDRDNINIVNVDIEIAADAGFPSIELADKPITAITLFFKGIYYVYGIAPFNNTRDDVVYYNCETEYKLIQKFLEDWRKFDPDVITGWNVEEFDIPYLINRFTNIVGHDTAARMSPWNVIYEKQITKAGQEKILKSPLGVTVLDYLALYRKFTYKMQESYRLDNIAYVELGDRKLDYSEFGSLLELYKHDYQKFIEYNIKDVEIVQRLDDKLGLIDLVFALAYDAKVNYIDALTSV
jgi:DNA polymerase elongation subunit (family B)